MTKPRQPAFREYPVVSFDVIDGDSVKAVLDLGFRASLKIGLRLQGIDTPESSNDRQASAAMVSRMALARLLDGWWSTGGVVARTYKADKYGGRWLADLRPDGHGIMGAVEWMLRFGYGRPYAGEAKKPWTDEELAAILAKGREP